MSKIISKPWGHEEIWAETNAYIGKLLHIKAGHRLSLQYHEVKEETVYVVSGTLYVHDDTENVLKITKGGSFHVKPNQIHRFASGKNESVTLIEVSTPFLKDVVRIEDDYSRS